LSRQPDLGESVPRVEVQKTIFGNDPTTATADAHLKSNWKRGENDNGEVRNNKKEPKKNRGRGLPIETRNRFSFHQGM
jgi:hypothetical protein